MLLFNKLLVLAVLLGMSIRIYNQPAPRQEDKRYVQAKEFIRAKLKVPPTAEFPARAKNIIALKDGSYNVISWVDADNGSGARLRADWICNVSKSGNDWQVVPGFCNVQFARKLPITLPPDPVPSPTRRSVSRGELEELLRKSIAHQPLPPLPPDPASRYKSIHTNDYGNVIDEAAPCYYDLNSPRPYIELREGTKVEILARRESDEMYAVRTPSHVLCWADSIEVSEVEKIQ